MIKLFILSITILVESLFAQHRGLWVVRNSLTSLEDLQRLEAIHQQVELTDIYLQVRALGKNIYENQNNGLPLATIVKFCQNRNINLHAWINVFFIRSKSLPQNNNKPVLDEEYLLTNIQFKQQDWKTLKKAGVEGFFTDPNNYFNNTQIIELIKKLIAQYHLKGIHLDYIRLPGRGFIFSKALRTRYMKRYFTDPVQFFSDKLPIYSAQTHYKNFLLKEITKYVEHLHDVIKQIDNTSLLTAAVKPDVMVAKEEYFQDWVQWLEKSICDYVLIMNYSPDDRRYAKNLKQASSLPVASKIVCGIGAYYLDQTRLKERIEMVQNSNLKGFSLFSFNTLKEQPKLLTLIKEIKTPNSNALMDN